MKKALVALLAVGLVLMLTLGLAGGAVAAQPGGGERTRLIVTFDEAVNQAAKNYVENKGGQVLNTFDIVPGMVVLLPGEAIAGLRGIKGVREVGPDGRIYAIDAELDNSWGVQRVGAGVVHGYNKGSGVKLAIIDSGIDYNHSDLDGNYVSGYDFVNEDDDPMDDNGHGTHVTGTIAAEDNDAGVVGVAPSASIYALKVLNASGSGYWSDFIFALEWSVNNGIQVANMSLGASRDAPGVRDAVKAAYNAGIVLVAAAGNSGNPGGKGNSIGYPARYEEVVAVGATDQNDTRASFSSTGDQLELAAPGVDINSTLLGGGYDEWSGTSMASPHVAGTAALVIASGITDTNGNGRINDEVRLRLQQTADDLGDTGKDSQYGYGLVDADEAAPAPATTGSIAGTVTNADDGTAISGATVTVDTGQSVIAATDGTYTITGVLTGDRSVTASAAGFESQTKPATVTEGQTTTVDFGLNLIPVGSIAGTVSNASDSTAMSGATVTVDTGQSATTATDGTYTITGVPTGERSVTASADGFESQTKATTVIESPATTVDFALNPVTTATTAIVKSISYTTEGGKDKNKHLNITAALEDNLGNAVAGASVSIKLDNADTGESWTGTGTTETDGTVTFSLKNAPSGTYTTTVTKVTAAGLTWNDITPDNSFEKL